jgi:hypothetical protein
MSTGHLKYEVKRPAELFDVLGQGDTPKLYARRYRVDVFHDIPYTAGNSVAGGTVYVDQRTYRDVMDGRVYVRGMTPTQIINAWEEHEHSEWAIEMGRNPVQIYPAAHGFATCSEHIFVGKLPIDDDRYEACIRSALERAKKRFIKLGDKANPPRDLWCGPVVDDPDKDDLEIIRILRSKGVEDAFKLAKDVVNYGVIEHKCKDCRMWGDRDILPELRKCDLVNGLERSGYGCDRWVAKKGNGHVR